VIDPSIAVVLDVLAARRRSPALARIEYHSTLVRFLLRQRGVGLAALGNEGPS